MNPLCDQCPRGCRVDRERGRGFCGVGKAFCVSRAALHPWEEPFLSGTRGSGTLFFSGCNLRCVFCQNREISRGNVGKELSPEALEEVLLRLQEAGAHNLNLVTPTHYARELVPVLERLKPRLRIPVVYNCGGYERVESLRHLEGLVDIYLPDFKYLDAVRAETYSGAADYGEVATLALEEMLRQQPRLEYDGEGMLLRGVAVRHLVLPGGRKDSLHLLRHLAEHFGTREYLLSLMSQYTPEFALDSPYPELHRRVTTFEYESVVKEAERLGFAGCIQDRSSASSSYTPDFYEERFL